MDVERHKRLGKRNPDVARVRQLREHVSADVNGSGRIAYLDPLVRETLVDQISEHAFAKYLEHRRRAFRVWRDLALSATLWLLSIGGWAYATDAFGVTAGLVTVISSAAMGVCVAFANRNALRNRKRSA